MGGESLMCIDRTARPAWALVPQGRRVGEEGWAWAAPSYREAAVWQGWGPQRVTQQASGGQQGACQREVESRGNLARDN